MRPLILKAETETAADLDFLGPDLKNMFLGSLAALLVCAAVSGARTLASAQSCHSVASTILEGLANSDTGADANGHRRETVSSCIAHIEDRLRQASGAAIARRRLAQQLGSLRANIVSASREVLFKVGSRSDANVLHGDFDRSRRSLLLVHSLLSDNMDVAAASPAAAERTAGAASVIARTCHMLSRFSLAEASPDGGGGGGGGGGGSSSSSSTAAIGLLKQGLALCSAMATRDNNDEEEELCTAIESELSLLQDDYERSFRVLGAWHLRKRQRRQPALPLPPLSLSSPRRAPALVSAGKLRHDLDQLEYLVDIGRLSVTRQVASVRSAYWILLGVLEEHPELAAGESTAVLLDDTFLRRYSASSAIASSQRNDDLRWSVETTATALNQVLYIPPCQDVDFVAPVLNPRALAGKEPVVLDALLSGSEPPLVAVLDDVLHDRALASLRRFALEATIFNEIKPGNYLGAYRGDGFVPPVLAAIAGQLQAGFPAVFRNVHLRNWWSYKCDHNHPQQQQQQQQQQQHQRSSKTRGFGLGVHADNAAINVNLWLGYEDDGGGGDDDDEEAAGETAGLVVYPSSPPADASWAEMNGIDGMEAKRKQLRRRGGFVRVPFRGNRMVIFRGDRYHETDQHWQRAKRRATSKKESERRHSSYRRRRVNVTLLFGVRQRPSPKS